MLKRFSKRFSKFLTLLCCMLMVVSLIPISVSAETVDLDNVEASDTPTATFGTPELGSNDPLWNQTMEHLINKSTVPDDPRPHATGSARILWDYDYIYTRVVVEDSNLYVGPGGDHQYDSLEFYLGSGSNGSNQWRVSSSGVFSGQSHTDRAAWTEITDTGYIVEMRIPKRSLTLQPGKLTFEVYINNSSENGGDRYEVVSAFGAPDTGYGSHSAFADSLELIEAVETDNRYSIITNAGPGGKISPSAPGNVLRVEPGSDKTFTFTPDFGKVIDNVAVNNQPVTVTDSTYTLANIEANHTIVATFKNDSSANQLPFIVWNDNFARGEYTTAVIIDLGEGNEAIGSELNPDLFTVSARNTTLDGSSVTYEGTRKITRVYANDEPNVRGYQGVVSNSPDYEPGLESGRYIVIEFEFFTETGGNTTLDNSNSTKQVYSIVQNGEIVLKDGDPLSFVVFEQEDVVNSIIDKFTTHTSDSVNRALYLHKDDNGNVVQGLPLYVYTHGMSRGGTSAETDQTASMKSANGSIALMKKMEENPEKYASHILNISYNGISTPTTANVKKVIDDLVASGVVDSNRIYAAGFSWGGQYTNSLINAFPGFFAAAAPMAPVSGSPNASTDDAHEDLAYWMFLNVHNAGTYQTNLNTFINTNMPKMVNARASNFESNEALTWPYNQFDQSTQRPNPNNNPPLLDYIAHEVEAAVLYNQITMENPFSNETWSIAPIAQSSNLPDWDNDYTDVFDWMFAQSKQGEPVTPSVPSATFGTPELGSNDPLWSQTMEHQINRSTVPSDSRPHATGTVKVLWDNNYIYSRVVVEDSNLYQGSGADHTYDSLEFFVGPGSSGSNQWRVSATGILSGQSHTDRAAWTEITDTGYIVEIRIPKRDLNLQPGKFTFEVNINNSTENGADRYEVVSAFGDPDTGFGSDAAFRDSLELIAANEVDTRYSITLSADTGGKVTPNAPGNVVRVTPGSDKTFTIIPDHGKIVNAVTVDGELVTIADDNTFTLTNINSNLSVHVTFKDDPTANQLPFIVWNDNFASGEYTTAVIIDLGEGQEALGSALHPDLFTVSARNTTLVDNLVTFEGTRKIARVYANDKPEVRGYVGKIHNSPDYQEGLESGRYIVVEIEFYSEVGGITTLDGSNSTKQNYNIVQKGDIMLTDGNPLSYAVFKQEAVVNPILDKFTSHTSDSVNYALYLHKNENDEVVQGMPLYVYTHGFSRGGTQSDIDQKASMKSANGSVALMKQMEKNPNKYASHILNISYSGGSTPQIGDVKKIIDDMVASGLVDPNRIYASGFSMGAMFTNTLVNTYPGFFAAAAPLGIASGAPSASVDEAHKDQAYWIFVNAYDARVNASLLDNFINNDISDLTNARASRFESNEALTWPYNQYDQPSQRPNPSNTPPLLDYIAHEVEAAVLYNQITMQNPFTEGTWSIAPIAQSPNLPAWNNDYTDVFDWMFAQSKLGEIPDNDSPSAMFGTPQLGSNDPLWSKTQEYPINKSTVPADPRPHATGTVKVLWDSEYVYARVVVEDSDVYVGAGGDHTYDSIEFFVGAGSSGSNQWRVSANGVLSGQSHTDRAAWTQITDTGYIVEMRIPKRSLTLEPGKLTFEVNINNSTSVGADRYEVVSAFGAPDTGFNSDAEFRDSLELTPAKELDTRFSITTSTSTGGSIQPSAPGNVLRVLPGTDKTFTISPDHGKVVDSVLVNDQPITLTDDNTFTLTSINADQNIHVTFKDDSSAEQLSFIVWNDNFASGEYTTAVIIDLGEGNEALGSALHKDMFTVSARNTTFDNLVTFEGTRKISRVYANDKPEVRGYLGKVHNSPDYQEGLASGRYIVVELEFYTEVGGNTTLDSSNSTIQNYNIVQKEDIVLTNGEPINYAVFKQNNVVNPILDKFTAHSTESVNYALYLHKDEKGEEMKKMPLYVYTHGFSRGGTQAHIDQKASMKSANGSVALMKKMKENPDKYASHILNISYSGGSAPQVADIKAIIDDMIARGLVDPNRIYVSGFSMGGGVTTNLINTYPGFFAAAAPLGISSGWPTAEENRDLAYWLFVNTYDSGASNVDNMSNDIANLSNARASRFDSNEALSWPYNQYDQPSQRPNLANDPPLLRYIAHEVEAAVLYNQITMENPFTNSTWSIAPIIQSPNLPAWNNQYTDVYDWMFSQSKEGEPSTPDLPSPPVGLRATAGDRQVTLRWSAPTDNGGSAIVGYKVWYNDETPVTLDATKTQYTFTGLSNGQQYTFKIVAMNANGNSAEMLVLATPKKPTSSGPSTPGGGSGNTDNTGGDTGNTGNDGSDNSSTKPSYTIDTPNDKPAVTDINGNTTLPGGGVITTKGGTKIEVPDGTTIDSNGKLTIPADKSAKVTLRGNNGLSFNISGGTQLELKDSTLLGFLVLSGNPFKDVNKDHWFYSYVNHAYTYGLFNGTSSTTFSPSISMSHAMFVQVLANLENVKPVTGGPWYTAAVDWANDSGVVNGIIADLFDPNSPITREQMLVILYNYMNYKGYKFPEGNSKSFADESDISPWALEAVQALQGIGIVSGKPGNLFDPQATATRAEVATIFVRFIEYLAK